MKDIKVWLLTDRWFLFGLTLLLANDLILKYQFTGHITGKLSDVSGLFIFPFFWSILFERRRLYVYLLTGLIFVFWKLPVSTDSLDFVNHFLGTRFHRVVDHTDLVALLVMPFSFWHLNKKITAYEHRRVRSRTKPVAIALLSLLAFVATSPSKKNRGSGNLRPGAPAVKLEARVFN